MISINALFDTRAEADAFAREIEGAYPPETFGTALSIQRTPTPGTDAATFLVVGSRNERPEVEASAKGTRHV